MATKFSSRSVALTSLIKAQDVCPRIDRNWLVRLSKYLISMLSIYFSNREPTTSYIEAQTLAVYTITKVDVNQQLLSYQSMFRRLYIAIKIAPFSKLTIA